VTLQNFKLAIARAASQTETNCSVGKNNMVGEDSKGFDQNPSRFRQYQDPIPINFSLKWIISSIDCWYPRLILALNNLSENPVNSIHPEPHKFSPPLTNDIFKNPLKY
jgi:hypothetical protein